jgi:hypothetical protein
VFPASLSATGGFRLFMNPSLPSKVTPDSSIFVHYDDGVETIVLQPAFAGSALELAVVVPFLTKPEIVDAREDLFDQLEGLTRLPPTPTPTPTDAPEEEEASEEASPLSPTPSPTGVQEVEKKVVGEYEVTVLTADSIEGLSQWLRDAGYHFERRDQSNFAYYVKTPGAHFAVIKVDSSGARVEGSTLIAGKLRPVAFSFETPVPVVPMRISASQESVQEFVLYTLADHMYFVPGADIEYSGAVTDDTLAEITALDDYSPEGMWLTRSVLRINPPIVIEDLTLSKAHDGFEVSGDTGAYRLNSDRMPRDAGITLGLAEQTDDVLIDDTMPIATGSGVLTPTRTQKRRPTPVRRVENLPETERSSNTPLIAAVIGFAVVAEIALVSLFAYLRRRRAIEIPEAPKKPEAAPMEPPKVEILNDIIPTQIVLGEPAPPAPNPDTSPQPTPTPTPTPTRAPISTPSGAPSGSSSESTPPSTSASGDSGTGGVVS